MNIVEKAARIAVTAHKEQVRKSDGSPYIVHPFMCAMLLSKHAFPDEVVAAALVHDVLEDTTVSNDELRAALGDTVADIVEAVSEDSRVDWRTIENGWEKRKEAYIETVRNASEGAKAVSVADKIHNLQSLLRAHEEQGPAVWKKFNRGKEAKLWFEKGVLTMLQETWQHPLVDEYAVLVARMEQLD